MTPGEGGEQAPTPQLITLEQSKTRMPQAGDTLVVAEKYNTHEVPVGPQGDQEAPVEGTDNDIQLETSEQTGQQTADTLRAQERAKTKQEIAESSREQRDANIEKLITELPDFIKGATSLEEAKEEYKKLLQEQGATDARIKGELARMDLLADRVEDMAESSLDDLVSDGDMTEEQAKEKKSKIRQFMESGLVSLGDFAKEGMETSSFEDIMKLFLVFGTEGRFGTSGVGEFSRGLEKDSSNAYLIEALEKGGEEGLKAFIEAILGKIDVGPLTDDNMKNLFKEMNDLMERDQKWEYIQDRLSTFLNNRDYPGDHKFDKDNIKRMIDTLAGRSADQIRKTFGISTLETSSEAEESSADSDQKTSGNDSEPSSEETTPTDQVTQAA